MSDCQRCGAPEAPLTTRAICEPCLEGLASAAPDSDLRHRVACLEAAVLELSRELRSMTRVH